MLEAEGKNLRSMKEMSHEMRTRYFCSGCCCFDTRCRRACTGWHCRPDWAASASILRRLRAAMPRAWLLLDAGLLFRAGLGTGTLGLSRVLRPAILRPWRLLLSP